MSKKVSYWENWKWSRTLFSSSIFTELSYAPVFLFKIVTWITHCIINCRCANWSRFINIICQAVLSFTKALSCCFLKESQWSQAARASETLCSCCSAHRHYNVVMQLSSLEALCTWFLEALWQSCAVLLRSKHSMIALYHTDYKLGAWSLSALSPTQLNQ